MNREGIAELVRRMRHHLAQADKFDADWNRINAVIDRRHREERVMRERTGQKPLTDLMAQKDKTASIPLTDAFGAQTWHRAQAHMLATVVSAELEYARYLAAERARGL